MKDNRHDDFDFEAEAERVHKKLSKIHDAKVKNSHMKYEKGLSNLDKYCKNYMKSEFDKIAHSDPDYDYVSARISINAMSNFSFLKIILNLSH